MVEKNDWVFFRDIDWNDAFNNRFNIDTRDFHSGYFLKVELHPDWHKIKKYKHFFHTETELVELIERYHKESGGIGKWRMMDLEHKDERVNFWNFKYIRIWRTELGFVVCNSKDHAIQKNILNSKVAQEYLHHH